jgi:tripartite-type tricarboxylate transporter receptor subunit TctC
VTTGVGSTTDFMSRLIAQGLTGTLGQQVIVDNRADNIAQEIVAKAPPDGYTLLVTGTGFWVEPLLHKTNYDPVKDFSPVILATRAPNVLVVHPSLPAKSVTELIALAAAKPGQLNFASAGTGGSAHLAGELFKAATGINMVHVPYKSAGPAVAAVIGGEVQLMFATTGSVAPFMKTDKLRVLGVTTAQATNLVPGVPTVSASVPGYEAVSMVSVFAPQKTPALLISRLNQEIAQVLNRAETKERLFAAGVEVVASSSQELDAKLKSEIARLSKVIKEAGIRGG